MRTVRAADIAPQTYRWSIEARNLTVKAGRHQAVNGLDLSLGIGVHGLLGANGAGKTTLMRCLATVIQPAGGELSLLGAEVSRGSRLRGIRRDLGYLPQAFGYYPRFTVREFVEYVAWLKETPAQDIPGAVQRAVERVGLEAKADAKMKSLSGGMLRRAGIAQAIVNDPAVLLLDEPTVGLDPEQRLDFRDLLRTLGVESCLLVSTHLVEDVAAACTDVVMIHEGRTAWTGTPEELAAAGADSAPGDSPTERGYATVLGRYREQAVR
ncbi:ABC transporter ATP-binding protein [Kineosporia mesophila]|uniref:ABC transporter ATP-binding protein n=1 Tax=Kineosporia mesophila TaxID=566012 RepID=A0ABP7A5D9_9ACTN|nr:ATP-binding cassette domain-containing protein [Kineosporia mesophila]MCD5351503.1 ATP-binding cassette domain-containing protein [Kineosporia mesophila]